MIPILLLSAALGGSPGPLAIESPTVDLGERAANKPLVHVFRLKNAGTTPLTIVEVTGVCGCVRREVGASVLQAGEATDLTVGINLFTQPEGPNSWKLVVRYKVDGEPPTTGERIVQVAAKVKKDVSVEPVAHAVGRTRDHWDIDGVRSAWQAADGHWCAARVEGREG